MSKAINLSSAVCHHKTKADIERISIEAAEAQIAMKLIAATEPENKAAERALYNRLVDLQNELARHIDSLVFQHLRDAK